MRRIGESPGCEGEWPRSGGELTGFSFPLLLWRSSVVTAAAGSYQTCF